MANAMVIRMGGVSSVIGQKLHEYDCFERILLADVDPTFAEHLHGNYKSSRFQVCTINAMDTAGLVTLMREQKIAVALNAGPLAGKAFGARSLSPGGVALPRHGGGHLFAARIATTPRSRGYRFAVLFSPETLFEELGAAPYFVKDGKVTSGRPLETEIEWTGFPRRSG